MNISNNLSSIVAHQTMLNSSANNIANVNTERYVPSDVNIVDNKNSVDADVRKSDDSGYNKSQTDLSKEIPDQIVSQDATSVNTTAIKTKDEMLGSLLDIKA